MSDREERCFMDTLKKVTVGAAVGTVFGTALGMALAPKSGRENRKQVAKAVREMKNNLNREEIANTMSALKSSFNDAIEELRAKIDALQGVAEEKAAEAVQEAGDLIEEIDLKKEIKDAKRQVEKKVK